MIFQEIIPSLSDIRQLLPSRPKTAHKGTMGKVLIIAGSFGLAGAALLSSKAVVRSGAGLTTLATVRSLAGLIDVTNLEVMTVALAETRQGTISNRAIARLREIIPKMDTVLIGPGLSSNKQTLQCITDILQFISQKAAHVRTVVDADGLKALKPLVRRLRQPLILTPHLGELAQLVNKPIREVQINVRLYAQQVADRYGAVVLAKSSCSLIIKPRSRQYLAVTNGNPGLAKGGSGDVLAGMIAGLWYAHRLNTYTAAAVGAYIHALAGNVAAHTQSIDGIIASDIITAIPVALKYVKGF